MLGSTEEALRHFDAAVQLAPNDGHVVASRADLLTDMGRYAYAAAEYDRAIALDGRLEHAYRSSAWLLATCPDDSVRNAELAIEHAQRAIELERRENPISLDTLAAAQANSGKFEAAIETMHQVLEIAPDAEQEVYQARLANYELGKPFRVKPIAQFATVSYDE